MDRIVAPHNLDRQPGALFAPGRLAGARRLRLLVESLHHLHQLALFHPGCCRPSGPL